MISLPLPVAVETALLMRHFHAVWLHPLSGRLLLPLSQQHASPLTLKDMPVSLPLSSGSTLPTALAAPVEEGMMLAAALRPPLQSLPAHLGLSVN